MDEMTDPSLARSEIDLTNCDREPIHTPGRIQHFGALLAVTADWIVTRASANAADFLGLETGQPVGRPLSELLPSHTIHEMRTGLQMLSHRDAVARLFGVACAKEGDALYDIAVHRSEAAIVMEFERHDPQHSQDYATYIRPLIERIAETEDLQRVFETAVRQVRAMTGMDRVMLYRFSPDETGEVIAESVGAGREPFLGLRYPASDIPKQARALYLRNLLRIIADTEDEGIPVMPVLDAGGAPLDLSLSTTRAVSPIHLEYLRNMGVRASMSVSIVVRGRLWGLFACHHDAPKVVSYRMRSAVELFAQLFAFVIDQKESDAVRAYDARARLLHDRIMGELAAGHTVEDNFEAIVGPVGDIIPHDGAVGWIGGRWRSVGQTPDRADFEAMVPFLNTAPVSEVYALDSIAERYAPAEAFAERAAGMLVLPVSRRPRDYIVFFRREIAQAVRWAGNPDKPVEASGPNGSRLTPRKSFEAWLQTVRSHSAPWTTGELRAAESLRITLLEVVLRLSDETNRQQEEAREKQELLIAELNHRVRNILNLIKSLTLQSREDAHDAQSFGAIVGSRIDALARAHDQITRENWSRSGLHELIRTEVAAYLSGDPGRLVIEGPDVLLEPGAFTTLALVIHELMTNSIKYGALSREAGCVVATTALGPDGTLSLAWRERGGPAVQAPLRQGFGTTIIRRSIPFELGGTAEVRYAVTGLEADFTLPPAHFEPGKSADQATPAAVEAEESFAPPSSMLVVEDNLVIALEAESLLTDMGVETVTLASRVADALRAIETDPPDSAILDVNLGSETSEPVARVLAGQGIPFVFATGYGELKSLIEAFPGVTILQKPYSREGMERAIARSQGTGDTLS